jgi:hypoxanthine phosphoribosyltransferase
MNGALMPASQLSLRMNFPFQISYLHAPRYRGDTQGRTINWVARPNVSVQDRTILVIDDIFDEGTTLRAIIEEMKLLGAKKIYSAVLVNKIHDRKEDLTVDFIGLDVEDRYVFGYGMDYKEYWRNLPAIYAVRD